MEQKYDGPNIGFHLDATHRGSDVKAMQEKTGATAVQWYSPGSKATPEDNAGVPVVYVHSNHMTAAIYRNVEKSNKAFRTQLETAAKIGAIGVVLHLVNDATDDGGAKIKQLLKFASDFKRLKLKLILEPTSSTKNYHNVARCLEVESYLKAAFTKKTLAWCFDSAHLHGGGHEMSGDGFLNTLECFRKSLHFPIQLLHLNGSLNALGSGKDSHTVNGEKKGSPMPKKLVAGTPLGLFTMNLDKLGKWADTNHADIIVEQRIFPLADATTTSVCKQIVSAIRRGIA